MSIYPRLSLENLSPFPIINLLAEALLSGQSVKVDLKQKASCWVSSVERYLRHEMNAIQKAFQRYLM
jgi:hypothetical protein